VLVNGKPVETAVAPNTYVALKRVWKRNDKVTLQLDMETHLVHANPRVSEDFGKVAVQRGPLVYALEQPDNPGAPVFDVALDTRSPIHSEVAPKLAGGVVVLKARGLTYARDLSAEPLYGYSRPKPDKPVDLTLIPYYLFHDRGPAAMTVWLGVQ
jgi:DUF1680 family protein